MYVNGPEPSQDPAQPILLTSLHIQLRLQKDARVALEEPMRSRRIDTFSSLLRDKARVTPEALSALTGYMSVNETKLVIEKAKQTGLSQQVFVPGAHLRGTVIAVRISQDGEQDVHPPIAYVKELDQHWSEDKERALVFAQTEDGYERRPLGSTFTDSPEHRFNAAYKIHLQDPAVKDWTRDYPTNIATLYEFYAPQHDHNSTQMGRFWRARQTFRSLLIPDTEPMRIAEELGSTRQEFSTGLYYCSRCGGNLGLTTCTTCDLHFRDDKCRSFGYTPMDEQVQHCFEMVYGHQFLAGSDGLGPKRWRVQQDEVEGIEETKARIETAFTNALLRQIRSNTVKLYGEQADPEYIRSIGMPLPGDPGREDGRMTTDGWVCTAPPKDRSVWLSDRPEHGGSFAGGDGWFWNKPETAKKD